ncbi:hypothetical protein ACVGWR_04310, partial [Enterobacter hormaechei]
ADAGRDCACSVAGAGVNNAGWGVGFPPQKNSQFMPGNGTPTRQTPDFGHNHTKKCFFWGFDNLTL